MTLSVPVNQDFASGGRNSNTFASDRTWGNCNIFFALIGIHGFVRRCLGSTFARIFLVWPPSPVNLSCDPGRVMKPGTWIPFSQDHSEHAENQRIGSVTPMRGLGSEKIVCTCTTGCSEFYAISDFYGATTIENSIDAKCVFLMYLIGHNIIYIYNYIHMLYI